MKSKIGRILLTLLGVLTPFLIGALITVISMIGAFRDLGEKGITDPSILAAHIGTALTATFIGVYISVPLFIGWIVYVVVQLNSPPPKPRPS